MKEPEMAIPPLFMCPISLDLFKDPVTLCTGQTYDRSSIEKWISSGKSTCPVTMQRLHDPSMVPNHTLKHLIHQWLQLNYNHGYDLDYFQETDSSIVSLKQNLQSKESTLEAKVQALDKVLVLSQDPLENPFLIQLGFCQMVLELAFESSTNVKLVEKALCCGLKLLPFSDLATLNMLKEDQSKFNNLLILFSKGTPFIKRKLCHLIVAISSNELLSMLGKSKILIQELVQLIHENNDESIEALSALSSLDQNREFIVKGNAVEALIGYIWNASKCKYRSLSAAKAMKTIETLLVIRIAKEAVLKHPNGLTAIVKLVFRVSSNNEASESALNSLTMLCHDFVHAREEVICGGVLSQLLLLLQSQCSERTKTKARMLLKLLRTMCNGDQKQAL